jgi:hypothetical protein
VLNGRFVKLYRKLNDLMLTTGETTMKLALATVAVCAASMMLSAPAAAFEYSCVVERIVPPEGPEADPVVQTTINPRWSSELENAALTGLAVSHETARGVVYARHRQYAYARVWLDHDGSANWVGRLRRDPAVVMKGSLVFNSMRYIETITRNGALQTTIVHRCEHMD